MGLQILSQLFHPPPNCATLPIPRSIFSSILFILYTSHNNISDPWATWIHSNLLFSIRIPVENPRNLSIYSRVIDAYQELTFYDPSIFVRREWERERKRESERKRERERKRECPDRYHMRPWKTTSCGLADDFRYASASGTRTCWYEVYNEGASTPTMR